MDLVWLSIHAVFVGGFQSLAEPGPELFVEGEARGIVLQDGEKIGLILVFRA